jgi:hypothetical protein
MSVARSPAKRPKTRKINQKTFTRMLDDEGMKGEVRWWRCGGDRDMRSERGNLFRYLSEDRNVLLEVIHHLVCRIDLQVLLAVDDKGGKGCRE